MEAKVEQLSTVIDGLLRYEVFRIGPVVVTTTVVNTWIVMAVLTAAVWLMTRKVREIPRGAQALMELLIEFVYFLIDTGMGRAGRKFLPIVGTLFIFIAALNISWFIPNMVPPTTDLMTTAGLAIATMTIVHIAGVRAKGVGGYVKHFMEPIPALLPMNLIEEVVKPFSLAIRLFGNMFGEKMVVTILFILFPLLAPTPVMGLGILMGLIQAFIFSLLSVTYLGSSTQGH